MLLWKIFLAFYSDLAFWLWWVQLPTIISEWQGRWQEKQMEFSYPSFISHIILETEIWTVNQNYSWHMMKTLDWLQSSLTFWRRLEEIEKAEPLKPWQAVNYWRKVKVGNSVTFKHYYLKKIWTSNELVTKENTKIYVQKNILCLNNVCYEHNILSTSQSILRIFFLVYNRFSCCGCLNIGKSYFPLLDCLAVNCIKGEQ